MGCYNGLALSETLVAIDLETTGVDPIRDAIIEIGAVRFNIEDGILDEFTTLINPRRPIPPPVQRLTDIPEDEVMNAPILEVVASDVESFIGDHPLVGHYSAAFDAPFLDAAGIRHSEVIYDTYDLASLLLPGAGQYSLRTLVERFGVSFPVQHRALPDAVAHMELFLALYRRADQLSPSIISSVCRWVASTHLPWRQFFLNRIDAPPSEGHGYIPIEKPSLPDALQLRTGPVWAEPSAATDLLASAVDQPELFPQFEERPQQMEMAVKVAERLNEGGQLIVEAATGTGKSLAYLAPASLYALEGRCRLVISTATINLQEQLVGKDIPILKALLAARSGDGSSQELRTAQLKGRRNYLCLRRLSAMQMASQFTDLEAKMMARLSIWLAETDTGDRSELNLNRPEEAIWQRLSAESSDCNAGSCFYAAEGTCFLARARRRAEAAHIVVVNHALLLSNVAAGGHLLPSYSHLIIDEGHHLEEEATQQLGFSAREEEFASFLDRCQRLTVEFQAGLRSPATALGPGASLSGIVSDLTRIVERARIRLQEFADEVRNFMREQINGQSTHDNRLLIDRAMRVQPGWSDVELTCDNLRLALSGSLNVLDTLSKELASMSHGTLLNYDLLTTEASALLERGALLSEGVADAVGKDDEERIVWIEEERRSGSLTVASAPLQVGELLKERLYEGNEAVVVTGATLASRGSFEYIRERLGLEEAEDLRLESPFDYGQAALVLLPTDMPEPSQKSYMGALTQAVSELGEASQGRALVLFTSHASLRAAYGPIRDVLTKKGVDVLGQGIDGPPPKLLRSLRSNPRTLLLGTASFWEGVDIAGEALSLLVMAKLPFTVPTDPIFSARSTTYDNPFGEYALPQAVLRFKQGFGRLIRSKRDRGVAVILDSRISSKRYGRTFLESLPPCKVHKVPLRELSGLTIDWLSTDGDSQASSTDSGRHEGQD